MPSLFMEVRMVIGCLAHQMPFPLGRLTVFELPKSLSLSFIL